MNLIFYIFFVLFITKKKKKQENKIFFNLNRPEHFVFSIFLLGFLDQNYKQIDPNIFFLQKCHFSFYVFTLSLKRDLILQENKNDIFGLLYLTQMVEA